MIVVSDELLVEARSFKNEFLLRMFGADAQAAFSSPSSNISVVPTNSNIVGVGYGAKLSGGTIQEELAIRVYVRAKLSQSLLSSAETIPSNINGAATDIVQVGDITALARPTKCGASIGHFAITAGTLGCLVTKSSGSAVTHYILSNNHVLANSNSANINDMILEPGPVDGAGATPIAKLTDFELIKLGGGQNFVDAAIAEVLNIGDVEADILTIGNIQNPPVPAAVFQSVRKHGRTTQHTVGIITDLSADIQVRFGGQIATFDDQLAITGMNGPFSSGGDSGSLIVDAVTRHPVGLLFAGGGNTTFANPIEKVLSRFDAVIL
ncbi:MAG: hypothetical protein RBJ76_04300 [Stenomitos frigidus ULC029]